MKSITLKGVKQNNLKNINAEIPLGSFTVICGPSGSGKSSLAFQTLFAEGQRRYIESLSNYTKQFLNKAPKPDVEHIENIPPAISIQQKNNVKTSRSTVGTTTEVLDYLRLLFAKIGLPHCPKHESPVSKDTVSSASLSIAKEFNEQRGYLLCPIEKKERALEGKKLLSTMLQDGFLRIYVPEKKSKDKIKGNFFEINTPESIKKGLPKDLFYIVIDRLVIKEDSPDRLADSISLTYQSFNKYNITPSGGRALLLTTEGVQRPLSEEFSCSLCNFTFPTINPRLFSFNSPTGACTDCNGFGNILSLDENKVIPNQNLSISEGAISPFAMPSAVSDRKALMAFCKKTKISTKKPWKDLTSLQKEKLWSGTDDFYGVEGLFQYFEKKKYKLHVRVFISRFKSPNHCNACKGSRLNQVTDHILINKKSISHLTKMTIEDLYSFLEKIKLKKSEKKIAQEVLKQILSRLKFLMDVGVEYLTLERETRTLSGGEYQRLNLASQLGMELSQTLYVLDEPTVGLHPRDNNRLITILQKLNNLGNTLVVVEHDKDVINSSSHVIEMGPNSGHLGGEILFSGKTSDFYKFKGSNTVKFLQVKNNSLKTPGKKPINKIQKRPVVISKHRYKIKIDGCTGHNLKNTKVEIPLNRLVVITGVSGSGKSSLITQTLYPALEKKLTGTNKKQGLPYKKITGFEEIKHILFIDQGAVGKSSRSNPVTYLKIFDAIRTIMSSTDESKKRNYTPGTFSLNVEAGRCPICKGTGVEVVEMPFMDDIEIACDTCDGKKFQDDILEITYKHKNINDILNLTVSEAIDFFVAYPNIRRPLAFLREVGLDYIRLGQSASSLSGGESQRLKIAREFNSSQQKNTVYILDEPTTGLHFREIQLLLKVLNKLIDIGGSVLVIEHNLDIVAAADYIIDIGPEAGAKGGQVVFTGSPDELVKKSNSKTAMKKLHSHTGEYLKKYEITL